MKRLAAVLTAALLSTGAAHADQFVQQGEFLVHYAAMPTQDLTPEVARTFGIRRSRHRALLTLNAQRRESRNTTPVPASAKGYARNLIGQTQTLELRAVREGQVHYVIAEFEVLDQEWLNFEVSVLPEGATQPLLIRFKQQFYTDY